jgi:hypothetical protein
MTMISELPVKPPADTVLRQSRLVISPPVSLGNDTTTADFLDQLFTEEIYDWRFDADRLVEAVANPT